MQNPFEESEESLWASTNDEDKAVQLDAYNSLTSRYLDRYKYSQAISTAHAGIELARQLGNKPMEAEMQYLLGVSCGSSDRFEDALVAFDEAIEIHRIYSDERFLAKSLMFKGMSLRDLKRIDEASETWTSATALYDSVNAYWQAADVCLYHATMLRLNNRHELAYELFGKAYNRAQDAENLAMAAKALDGLGTTLHEMNRSHEAVDVMRQCMELYEFLEDDYQIRTTQVFYAQTLAATGEPEQALQQLEAAITSFKETSQRYNDAARAESIKAQVLMQLGRHDEGITLHRKLRTVFAAMKNKDEMLYHDIDFAPFLAKVKGQSANAVALLNNALEKALDFKEREAFVTASLNLAAIHLSKGKRKDDAYDFIAETSDQEWGEYYLERLRHKAIRAQVLYTEGHTQAATAAIQDARTFAKRHALELGHAFDIVGDWAKEAIAENQESH